jgi:hypothetical protein
MDEIERAGVLEHRRSRKLECERKLAAIWAFKGSVDRSLISHAASLAKWFNDARKIRRACVAERPLITNPSFAQGALPGIKQIEQTPSKALGDCTKIRGHEDQDPTKFAQCKRAQDPFVFHC